jgi:transcriptional regulator with XRE-family HTH domain
MFSEWLMNELNKREINQSELARLSGISRGAISHIINGVRQPGPEVCDAIAKALKLPPETVFRAAGLLPPKPEIDQKIEDLNHLLRELPPGDLEEIELIIRMKLNRQGTVKQSRKSAARTVLKG